MDSGFILAIGLTLLGVVTTPDPILSMDLRPYHAAEQRDYSRIVFCRSEWEAEKVAAAIERRAAGVLSQEELANRFRLIAFIHMCESRHANYTFVRTLRRGKIAGTETVEGKKVETTKDASLALVMMEDRTRAFLVTRAQVPPASQEERN